MTPITTEVDGAKQGMKYRKPAPTYHRRDSSEAGTNSSIVLTAAKESIASRDAGNYGALVPRSSAHERQLLRDLSSRMNPDQQIMRSGLLQCRAQLGTDDQPRDGEEEEKETHPLLA